MREACQERAGAGCGRRPPPAGALARNGEEDHALDGDVQAVEEARDPRRAQEPEPWDEQRRRRQHRSPDPDPEQNLQLKESGGREPVREEPGHERGTGGQHQPAEDLRPVGVLLGVRDTEDLPAEAQRHEQRERATHRARAREPKHEPPESAEVPRRVVARQPGAGRLAQCGRNRRPQHDEIGQCREDPQLVLAQHRLDEVTGDVGVQRREHRGDAERRREPGEPQRDAASGQAGLRTGPGDRRRGFRVPRLSSPEQRAGVGRVVGDEEQAPGQTKPYHAPDDGRG